MIFDPDVTTAPIIKIGSRWDSTKVLFEHRTTEAQQASCLATRDALEAACNAGANLTGANLDGANLAGANLAGANLARANLDGANLDGAKGEKFTLVGKRPVLQIGPIGSRCALLSLYLTDAGPMVRAGCSWNSLDAFEDRCEQTHGNNEHGKEYGFAALLMRAHAELWTPLPESGIEG